MTKSLASILVDKFHSEGIYFFDNRDMLEERIDARKNFFDNAKRDKNFKHDIYLLSSLCSVLPLCFTDYKRFLNYVGEENFLRFVNACKSENANEVYECITLMATSLEQKYMLESVSMDTSRIEEAVKRLKGGGEHKN